MALLPATDAQIAQTLVRSSARVQPGERVLIALTETHAYPLALAVYTECINAGAYPQVQLTSSAMRAALLERGNAEQVGWVPELEVLGIQWADVYFGLRGAANPFDTLGVPGEVLAAHAAANGVVSAHRWAQTRWCLVRIPDESMAVTAPNVSAGVDGHVSARRWPELDCLRQAVAG